MSPKTFSLEPSLLAPMPNFQSMSEEFPRENRAGTFTVNKWARVLLHAWSFQLPPIPNVPRILANYRKWHTFSSEEHVQTHLFNTRQKTWDSVWKPCGVFSAFLRFLCNGKQVVCWSWQTGGICIKKTLVLIGKCPEAPYSFAGLIWAWVNSSWVTHTHKHNVSVVNCSTDLTVATIWDLLPGNCVDPVGGALVISLVITFQNIPFRPSPPSTLTCCSMKKREAPLIII